jgi:hypothetical protein
MAEVDLEVEHYVYLVQEREFLLSGGRGGVGVYKIGKTTQSSGRRMMSYPKGSRVYAYVSVENCHEVEAAIIADFDKTYHRRSDVGREYYEGDLFQMRFRFLKIVEAHFVLVTELRIAAGTAPALSDEALGKMRCLATIDRNGLVELVRDVINGPTATGRNWYGKYRMISRNPNGTPVWIVDDGCEVKVREMLSAAVRVRATTSRVDLDLVSKSDSAKPVEGRANLQGKVEGCENLLRSLRDDSYFKSVVTEAIGSDDVFVATDRTRETPR